MPQTTGLTKQRNQFRVINSKRFSMNVFYFGILFFFFFSDKILLSKERMTELLSIQSARVEELHQLNGTMRSQLAVHHQLISDVRSILKTMAKVYKTQ